MSCLVTSLSLNSVASSEESGISTVTNKQFIAVTYVFFSHEFITYATLNTLTMQKKKVGSDLSGNVTETDVVSHVNFQLNKI